MAGTFSIQTQKQAKERHGHETENKDRAGEKRRKGTRKRQDKNRIDRYGIASPLGGLLTSTSTSEGALSSAKDNDKDKIRYIQDKDER